MNVFKKRRLQIVTLVYWFLLAYILAMLVFWFIELQRQNTQMTNYKLQELKHDDPAYADKVSAILEEQKRKTAQYVGEDGFFLIVILIAAIFLYRAVMRQIRLQQQQQNFMMAVTHELKTPIAVTRLNLETLQKHQLDEPRRQRLIQSALQETSRLNTMANNILVSAQLEGGRYQLAHDELDLSALVNQGVSDFRNRYTDIRWVVNVEPELIVTGDPLLLQILVNNLIENAVKYAPRPSAITTSLVKDRNQVVLTVADEGPGIPASEKKKIFKKFYRIGNENTRTTTGTGLGLYLCKKIAADHHAQLTVSDNRPQGAVFTATF